MLRRSVELIVVKETSELKQNAPAIAGHFVSEANMRRLTPQITGGKKQSKAALIAIRVNLLCHVAYVSTKKKRTSYARGQFLSSVPLAS